MQLFLNGEPKNTEADTVAVLIAELGLDLRKLAVEQNGTIIPRSLHASTHLKENDRIEIVHFIGGG